MASVRNISPDRRQVPVLDREVDADELVEIPDELAWDLSWDPEVWEVDAPGRPAPDDPRTVAELQDELRGRGLPVSGNKPELIERLAQAESE